jgi:hypothetical protein
MQQAWHIFKKDTRFLHREIVLLFVLAAIFGWLAKGGMRGDSDVSDALEMLYAATIAYTVARLIQAEAIPGENQFWITRPYRRSSLLTSKFIFVIAFIQLPVLVVQLVILLLAGFSWGSILPGLLWTQVLILLAVSTPALALASMSASLVPFIASALALGAGGYVAVEISFRSMLLFPESIDWARSAIPLLTAAAIVPPVLYLQYRYRLTRYSAALGAGIALCGALIFVLITGPALFAVQSICSRRSYAVEVKRDPSAPLQPWWIQPDGRMNILLPLLISGVPDDVDPQIEMYRVAIRRADGRTMEQSPSRLNAKRNGGQLTISGPVFLDPDLADSIRNQAAAVRVSLFLTLYGNKHAKTIPFERNPVDAVDGLRCFDGAFDEVMCSAPFRWPVRVVSVRSPWGGETSFTRLISYSPFPAKLQLAPIVTRSAGPHWQKDRSAPREVTIESEEPLAYLRRDVEIPIPVGVR